MDEINYIHKDENSQENQYKYNMPTHSRQQFKQSRTEERIFILGTSHHMSLNSPTQQDFKYNQQLNLINQLKVT